MISLLGRILDTVLGIGQLVLWAIMTGLNAVMSVIGAAINLVLSVLPQIPAAPDPPAEVATASGWVAYFIPTGVILAYGVSLIAMWLIFLAARVLMKWTKTL